MTGRGAGAIATIQLTGDAPEAILSTFLRPLGEKPLEIIAGRVVMGRIVDGEETVDQATVGCEGPNVFAIHCHGNPLIVGRIMSLLQRSGAEVITAEQLLAKVSTANPSGGSIAAEVRQTLTVVKTVAGAEILTHQIESGLSAKARQWQKELGATPLSKIAAEAERILRESEPARLVISGCTIALVGPPSTGKSTLLNTLAGREKAVVTDTRGTTRDWVSADIHTPPLAATIIDTAGIDLSLAGGEIDRAAQRKSIEILDRSDLILLVLDIAQPADQLDKSLADRLRGRKTVVVLNKADLPAGLDCTSLPSYLGPQVRISAKEDSGIEELIQAIHHTLGTTAFDPKTPIAFTRRQTSLLEQLTRAPSSPEARRIVSHLWHESPIA
jgi:tRNA modification GTPase